MPTTNRGYATPATGTEVDTWGDVINANLDLIDKNLGAVSTIVVSNTDYTLSAAEAACGTIVVTGTVTVPLNVRFPNVSGWWKIVNQTTGLFVGARLDAGGNQIGIPQASALDIYSDGTSMFYANLPPVGTYLDMAVSSVPTWITGSTIPPYLNADGSTFSSSTYPVLATLLGSTTLPDLRGRARYYLNGGSGRITTGGSGINGDAINSAGGSQSKTLVQANVPNYNLSPSSITVSLGTLTLFTRSNIQTGAGVSAAVPGAFSDGNNNTVVVASSFNVGGSIPSGGSGTAFGIMPPAYISGITLIRAA